MYIPRTLFGHDPRWSNLAAMEHHWDSIEHNLQLLLFQCLRRFNSSWGYLLRHFEHRNTTTTDCENERTKGQGVSKADLFDLWGLGSDDNFSSSLNNIQWKCMKWCLYSSSKCLTVITWSQCHWPANQDSVTASQTAESVPNIKRFPHTYIWGFP